MNRIRGAVSRHIRALDNLTWCVGGAGGQHRPVRISRACAYTARHIIDRLPCMLSAGEAVSAVADPLCKAQES
jgi:hypothetical protein